MKHPDLFIINRNVSFLILERSRNLKIAFSFTGTHSEIYVLSIHPIAQIFNRAIKIFLTQQKKSEIKKCQTYASNT